MKKRLLAIIALATLTVWPVAHASARSTDATITIRANGSVCEETGSISPAKVTTRHGDNVMLTFKNTERLPVEVRNIPGGTFVVPGNDRVERTFEASSSFVYSAWSLDGNCEKATARIAVTGGWWQRTWPWLLALAGSIIVIWLVSRAGRGKLGPPTNPAQ